MRYGRFDNEAAEYVIERVDLPVSWTNYLGVKEMGAVLNQTAGGYIFYSLGNWCFGGNTAPRDRDTAIAQVKLTLLRDGTYSVDGYQLIPCCLSSTAGTNDFRPVPYEQGTEEFTRTMSKLDGSFTGPDLNVDYSFLN